MEFTSRSLDDTAALARRIASLLRAGDILALDAPMGAGKTTFVRTLAEAMGTPAGMVSSPTFVLAHQYPTTAGPTLVHVDAYRLTSAEDLDSLGWDRLASAANIVVIEWAERIAEALEADRTSWIRIAPVTQGTSDAGVRRFVVGGAVGARCGSGGATVHGNGRA